MTHYDDLIDVEAELALWREAREGVDELCTLDNPESAQRRRETLARLDSEIERVERLRGEVAAEVDGAVA